MWWFPEFTTFLDVVQAAYIVMVGGDEPQLQVQVVVPLLHADEMEDIFMLHATHAVNLVLVLPRKLVLQDAR